MDVGVGEGCGKAWAKEQKSGWLARLERPPSGCELRARETEGLKIGVWRSRGEPDRACFKRTINVIEFRDALDDRKRRKTLSSGRVAACRAL